jgi:hypothetical protein
MSLLLLRLDPWSRKIHHPASAVQETSLCCDLPTAEHLKRLFFLFATERPRRNGMTDLVERKFKARAPANKKA